MSKLLLCPFCGGKAVILGYVIACKKCDAAGTPTTDKQKAIKHWNTRTDDKRITELRQQLKSSVEEAYDNGVKAVQDEANRSISELQAQVKDAFRAGYTQGHNDTVEGCYCLDDELKADEYIQEQKP